MIFLYCSCGKKKIKYNPVHKHEFWELIRLNAEKAFYLRRLRLAQPSLLALFYHCESSLSSLSVLGWTKE